MAKCNIFKTLSSGSAEVSNGSVLMLSQWANDLTKHMNDGDAYKVVPARFAAFNIDYNNFTAPSGATVNDKNKSVPEIFQNYIENASAFLKAEYSNDTEEFGSEENNTTEWNPNAFSLVFWDAMNNFFNVTADNSSETNGEGVANALYFVGDIDIVQDAPVDGYSYSEIKCILNNEDRRRAYVWEQNEDSKTTYAFPSKDYTNIENNYIFGWNETTYPTNESVLSYSPVFVGSNGKYGGVNPVLPQILNPFIDDIGDDIGKSEPIDTNNNTYFDEIADESEDYVNPMEMNTFVVFYDVITKNADSEYEYKYRSIPLCVYFTGPVAEEGEQGATTDVMQNPVQKYVSSSAAYGQGTSYGLSIATRCTVLPNMTLENGEAPVTTLNDYPEFAMVMSAFAEAIEELDKVQGEQEETNDLLKNHLAQFKDRKTNVPYIREINDSKYWFVNGRNTGAKAEGEAAGGASSLEDLDDVELSALSDGEILTYDAANDKWKNTAAGSSTDEKLAVTAIASPAGSNTEKYDLIVTPDVDSTKTDAKTRKFTDSIKAEFTSDTAQEVNLTIGGGALNYSGSLDVNDGVQSTFVFPASIEFSDGTNTLNISCDSLSDGRSIVFPNASGTVALTSDISDTWRAIKLNGSQILGTGTNTNALNLKKGTNMNITNSNGEVSFSSTDEIARATNSAYINFVGDGSVDITVSNLENTQLFYINGDDLFLEASAQGLYPEIRIHNTSSKIVAHKILISKSGETPDFGVKLDFDADRIGNVITYFNSSLNDGDNAQDPINGHSIGRDGFFMFPPNTNYMMLIDFTVIPDVPTTGKYTALANAHRYTKV